MTAEILGESILDAPKSELDKDIWIGKKFKPSHKKEIVSKIEKFAKKMFPENKIKKMYILGSITTFQYNQTSDIDVQIISDLSDKQIKELAKQLPNGWELGSTHHPVNYYLTNSEENAKKSVTLYDLDSDKWIREPKKSKVKVPISYILEIAKFFMDGIDLRIAEYERDKIELEQLKKQLDDQKSEIDIDELKQAIEMKENEIKSDLDAIHVGHHVFKAFRREGFDKKDDGPQFLISIQSNDPNYSMNNLVYKEIETHGYMDKLKKYEDLRDKMKL
jgi:hypothetical protein